jgi:hypothetical protein
MQQPVYNFDIVQGSDEWFALKVGKISATYGNDLLMDKKNKGYINLVDRLVEERMTGKRTESKIFVGNEYTKRGIELEPLAVESYELDTFEDTKVIGVVQLDDWCLCSPDRLIGDNALLQVKCPIFKTQRDYLRKKKVPTNYFNQMQFEMFVSKRELNVFYSWHPNLSPLMIEVKKSNETHEKIHQRLDELKCEVLKEIDYLNNLNKKTTSEVLRLHE